MAVRNTLQAELAAALRRRDWAVASAVRSSLSALANAEATSDDASADVEHGSPHVAGAVPGLAVTEAPRLEVCEDQQRAIVARERAELVARAERLAHLCRWDEANDARRAAAVLGSAVSGVVDT